MFSARRRRRDYDGVHVCITGGSKGLGFALAKRFVEENANVSLIARTAATLLEAKASLVEYAELRRSKSKVEVETGDCTIPTSVETAVRSVEAKLGTVDVLVCNAGTAAPGRFLETEIADFQSQMQLNYLGTIYAVKAVAKGMAERRSGEIVLISSALGVLGLAGYSAYAPSKWALRGFADCLRMEMQAHNVAVRIAYPPNMQTPGYETELLRTPAEVKEMMEASGDSVYPASAVASSIIKGMKADKYHLPSPDFLQTLSQSAMSGLSPAPFFLGFQAAINFVCAFLFGYFVRTFDRIQSRRHK